MSERRKQTREKWLQKGVVVCFLAMICCLLWGSAFPCIKIGYQMFGIASADIASQILFAGFRFFLAGILVLFLFGIMEKQSIVLKKKEIPMACVLATFQTVLQYLFFYMGLAHTTGVKSSIINGMNSFFIILISSLVFHQEKLTGRKMAGCLIGFAGVVLVSIGDTLGSGAGIDLSFRWNGELFILIASVAASFSSAFIKKYSVRANPVLLSGWQFTIGGAVLIAVGLATGGQLSFAGAAPLVLLFYMACISSVAYSLWAILLKYNPPSRIAVFGSMNPVFGVMLSAIFLKENGQAFSLVSLTSLFLVCAGIYIVNRVKQD